MLRRPEEIDWLKFQQQRVYSDEVFNRRADLLRLCERMWLSGMLGYTSESHSEVSACGVAKGCDSDGVMSIRAVWDERKSNILWQEAPFIPLGSPATLCHLDFSGLEEDGLLFPAIGGTCPTGSTGCASRRRCGHGSRSWASSSPIIVWSTAAT